MTQTVETPPVATSVPPWRKYLGWIIAGGVALALISFLAIGIGWYNSVRNGLIDRGTQLNAQYQANQAELDAFVKKVNEEFQIAGVKRDALNQVLTDAIRGRYENTPAATPGNGGGLINALQEAYPDLGGLNVYDKLVNEISAGRENFKQVQTKLLDQLREYESYRSKGIFHSRMASAVGYPNLEARIGRQKLTGEEALDQMHLIVTSASTSENFVTGEEGPIQFTPTTSP